MLGRYLLNLSQIHGVRKCALPCLKPQCTKLHCTYDALIADVSLLLGGLDECLGAGLERKDLGCILRNPDQVDAAKAADAYGC